MTTAYPSYFSCRQISGSAVYDSTLWWRTASILRFRSYGLPLALDAWSTG